MLENATNLCILNKDLFKKQLFSPRINGPILSYSKVLMFPFISLGGSVMVFFVLKKNLISGIPFKSIDSYLLD